MRQEDYRATLIFMAGFAAAAATGLLRETALAYELGAGPAADIFLIAFAVPEFVFVILPIVLWPAFIPVFTELRLHAGDTAAWRLGLRVAGALLALLLGVTALVALSVPIYLRWLAPGFGPLQRAQAVQAVYIMLPALSLMGGATLASAVLQVYRRFARPALATAVRNLTFVVVLLGAPLAWLAGKAAWGVTLGAAAALLLQLTLLWTVRPRTEEGDPDGERVRVGVTDVARLAGPLAAGYAVHHLILFVDRAMATMLATGSVATLNYAYRVALVVGQLSGLAVSTALFPRMAEQAANDDLPGLRSSLAGALRFVWMVGLPASCGLILLRVPLVEVLFQRGAFTQADTVAVSDLLVWYALAVLADALCQPLWRVLYAWRSAWTVFAVNALQTGIRLFLNLALIQSLGVAALALSAAMGLTIQALLLAFLVRRRIGSWLPASWWREMAMIVLSTAGALAVAGLLAGQLRASPPLVVLAVCGGSGALAYLLTLRILEKSMS